ncbi:hotdog family protein [Natrialbaceae archaeon A-gly3]
MFPSREISFRGPIAVGERATARYEIIDDLGESKFRVATSVLDESGASVLEGEEAVLVEELLPERVLETEPTV